MSLVAEPVQWTQPAWFGPETLTAVPVLGSTYSVAANVGSGDWAGALGSGANIVGDAVDFAVNPLGALASSAANFLLDRFEFFQRALDELVGNPAVVTAIGITWNNIGGALDEQATRLNTLAERSEEFFQGDTGDAYRAKLREMAEQAAVTAFACRCINAGFAIGSGIVTVVRQIVQALCAEVVGKVIAWAVQLAGTAGLSAPWVIPQAVSAIQKWARMAQKWMDELLGATGTFCTLLQNLYRAFDELKLYDLGITPHAVFGAGTAGAGQTVQTATG